MSKTTSLFLAVLIAAIAGSGVFMGYINRDTVDDSVVENTICPVTQRPVDNNKRRVIVIHNSKKYALCCKACKSVFEKNPESFLKRPVPVNKV